MALHCAQTYRLASLQSWYLFRSALSSEAAACKPSRNSFARTQCPQKTQRRMSFVAATARGISANPKLEASDHVLEVWRSAQAVCFDVDSTLCEDESIDELADFLGVGQQVADMTANAMGGSVKFEDALEMRLAIMKTSHQNIQDFLAAHPPRITKGITELVRRLQARNTAVYLVSGDFRPIINPIAEMLQIPQENVYANSILHDEQGQYIGFDTNEFTSRSGGKPAAIKAIKAQHSYSPLVMIGDGATDLEARQKGGADLFIGYGGVVQRPSVAAGADWYIYEIQQLLDAFGD